MLIPNRHNSSNSYRYGFQGQEKDDELKGPGNSLNYEFRMHDPRVGRWFAIDPLAEKYPSVGEYVFCLNNPILYIDPDGRDIELPSGTSRKDTYRILGSLQKLTNDKLVYFTQNDGTIKIKIQRLGKGDKTSGTSLIRKLNSDNNTVTISIGFDSDGNSNNTKAENDNNAQNGIGTNSTIMIDPDKDVSLRVDNGKGGTQYEVAPDEIILGHELVHSLDHVEGTLDRTKAKHTYKQLDGTTRIENQRKSEYKAVGFKGFTRKDKISENSLRKEQRLKKRASYEIIKKHKN